MKKIVIYLSLALVTTSVSFAQTSPVKDSTPKLRAERTMQQLQTKLLLSDKQKTDLYTIFFEQYSKYDSLKNANADRSVIKAQFKYDYAKITALLTVDQMAKYNNWMADRGKGTKR